MEPDSYSYTYSSTVIAPDGVRVDVTTTVPAGRLGAQDQRLMGDLSEVTQMGASYTAKRVADMFRLDSERSPF